MRKAQKTNILLILVDQMRGQAMGCAGDSNVDTPNLDGLAAEGIRFTSACSTYPVCVPYRFSLLTGETAGSRCVPSIHWRMSPCERTFAHEFNDAGYETAYIGKWHLYGDAGRDFKDVRIPEENRGGFKHWHGFELSNKPFETYVYHGNAEKPELLNGYQTDALFDIAMAELDELSSQEKPFMMMLSVEAPHDPYIAPENLMEKYRKKDIKLRENVMFTPDKDWREIPYPSSPRWEELDKMCLFKEEDGSPLNEKNAKEKVLECLAGYYAAIERVDENVGRIVKHLKKLDILDNTVVIFTSDHGDQHYSHGFFNKQFPFEESVNVPLIIRRAGASSEHIIDEPTCTEDLFPTLLGLAGLKSSTPKSGIDLNPLMLGKEQTLKRKGVYLEFVAENRAYMPFYKNSWRAFRSKEYKYILLGGKPFALYNLGNDPFELRNLINDSKYSEIQAELHSQLSKDDKSIGIEPKWQKSTNDEFLKRCIGI